MNERSSWVPQGVNVELPSAARVYDYLLGGGHNFAADRQLAERFATALPGSRDIARLNRAFLRRAVLFMVERGVDQFLDVGSGIPTVGNVHEIAQAANPEARVVYVDNEPVAVAHSQLILDGNDRAGALQEDLRNPEEILDHAVTRGLLDLDRPVGLLMVGVFHFVPEDWGPRALVDRYRSRLASGSYLALSHFTADSRPVEMAAMVEVMSRSKDPIHPRTRAEIEALFTGFELVEPGVVSTADWRPRAPGDGAAGPERDQIYAGVARLP
ncbi:SAM-dependent methyltransferase [Streptoalloteichus hindustanus]|uniref:SAM-dependent methyltransferase n=1 Tax=Streptoalloteichus hindustanus TaxID=2017 RepID=UPI000936B403|nr:SAM-dependent methyltransferase [Streptoalloteichus hindustanus]